MRLPSLLSGYAGDLRSIGASRVPLALTLATALLGCGPPIPQRSADSGRPALTTERIDRVVSVSEALRPNHPEVAAFLDERDISIGLDFGTGDMIPPIAMVGEDGVSALAAEGEDPAAFVRDVFLIRLVAAAVRQSGGVDEKMVEIKRADARLSVLALLSQNLTEVRDGMRRLQGVHAHVTPAEEEAVRSRMDRIYAVAFTRRRGAP